jgi:hypothetical protein
MRLLRRYTSRNDTLLRRYTSRNDTLLRRYTSRNDTLLRFSEFTLSMPKCNDISLQYFNRTDVK